jgi:hypothetical protein
VRALVSHLAASGTKRCTQLLHSPLGEVRAIAMTFHFEFFGPFGTAACTCLVPIVLYALALSSSVHGCMTLIPLKLPAIAGDTQVFSWSALAIVYFWFFAQLGLHAFLPARLKDGVAEPDGQSWSYRLNGTPHYHPLHVHASLYKPSFGHVRMCSARALCRAIFCCAHA